MTNDEAALCSIRNCQTKATHHESGETPHWTITIRYCDEHAREIEAGVPVGPVGIDPQRVGVHARGAETPVTGGILPTIGPH
jgi:hypothetical protein